MTGRYRHWQTAPGVRSLRPPAGDTSPAGDSTLTRERMMTRFTMAAVAAALVVGGAVRADDQFKPPAPKTEHDWLKKFVGEWENEAEMVMAPGQPPVKSKGTESVKMIGGLWMASEMNGECMGTPFTGKMTVGFNAQKGKYVGTWVCSMCDHMCVYEGTASGDTLTLVTDGPSPVDPAKTVKMKDVCEVKGPDERTMTSYMQGDDGQWVKFMTMTSKRKK